MEPPHYFISILHNKYIFSIIKSYLICKDHIALKYDQIDDPNWMINNGYYQLLQLKMKSNRYDSYSCLNIKDSICYWSPNSICKLLRDGEIELVKTLLQYPNALFDNRCSVLATELGNLDLLKLMYQHRKELIYYHLIEIATRFCHLDIIKYIRSVIPDIKVSSTSPMLACENGRLDIIKYLDSEDIAYFTNLVIDKAAEHGHLDIIEYLHVHSKKGCTNRSISMAAYNGHFKVIEYLVQYKMAEVSINALVNAAQTGRLDILQYFIEKKLINLSEWVSSIMDAAISQGHHHVIHYIISLKIPTQRYPLFSHSSITVASQNGDIKMLDFIYQNLKLTFGGKEQKKKQKDYLRSIQIEIVERNAFMEAAIKGDMPILDYILNTILKGRSTDHLCSYETFYTIIDRINVPALKYYVEKLNILNTMTQFQYRPMTTIDERLSKNPHVYEVVQYLYSLNFVMLGRTIILLSSGISLDLFMYFHDKFPLLPDVAELYNHAIKNRKYDVCTYISKNFKARPEVQQVDFAIGNKDLPMLQFLESLYTDKIWGNIMMYNEDSLNLAIRHGYYPVLAHILQKNVKPSIHSIEEAIFTKNNQLVKLIINRWKTTHTPLKYYMDYQAVFKTPIWISVIKGTPHITAYLFTVLQELSLYFNLGIDTIPNIKEIIFVQSLFERVFRKRESFPMLIYVNEILKIPNLKFKLVGNAFLSRCFDQLIRESAYEVIEYILRYDMILFDKMGINDSISESIDSGQKHITKLLQNFNEMVEQGKILYKPIRNEQPTHEIQQVLYRCDYQ
ncbi:ankyrin repeat-containing protein [Tieghemostelium lacteum]|uniref:Ankyrin repeat-containing protein n=1 Tax=Tieghemostelium lacteum TaxID=361077 RepID=A0A151Z9Y8_TIELA|nr:ankyrin repeat-containing protein [Tieghemostelium lacteum]|eukprot:KYQ90760.1 ankyrin repeat-containing protein [Tieghemostelium lacteum]